ncbi:MAG: polymorphic toxin type 44 domain-containing protein [Mariprofundales bacterium]
MDRFGLEPPEYPNNAKRIAKLNVDCAIEIYDPFTFRDSVKNSGQWDYKQKGTSWENFGNYNYGATGAASGLFTLDTLLREAGRAQTIAGTSKPEWCPLDNGAPYCDDPNDQYWIRQGWNDYQSGMYGEANTGGLLWGDPIQYWGGLYSKSR